MMNKLNEEKNSMNLEKRYKNKCNYCNEIFESDDYIYFWTCNKCKEKIKKEKIEESIIREIPKKFIDIETDKDELIKKHRESNLFIIGGTGSGKTVFACSMAKYHIKNNKNARYV